MKIGILSDSHDNLPCIDAALAACRERGAELLIHAGDFIAPFAVKRLLAAGLPVIAVFGNCDGERKMLAKLLPGVRLGARRESLAGRQFVVVHSLGWLKESDRHGADVIICGHTHAAEIAPGPPLVVNPGECGGWVNGRSTAAFLDTESMKPELIDLDLGTQK